MPKSLTSSAAPSEVLSQFVSQLATIDNSRAASITEVDELLDRTLSVLENGDFQARWEVSKLLPQIVSAELITPQLAIDALFDLLDEDMEEELAWFIVRILGQIEHPDVLAALMETLKSAQSEELRAMAAGVIAAQGTKAIAPLTNLLGEAEWRLLAVQALSQIRHSETIAPLLEVVQDADPQIRAAAIEALSSFHDVRIPPVLLNALGDIAAPVRREAIVGLGFHQQLADAIVPRLQACLYDFNLEVCRQAAIALGRLQSPAAADALFALLRSPHTPIPLQVETVRALNWIQTKATIEVLQQHLKPSADESVIQEILLALGRIEPDDLKLIAAQILAESIAALPSSTLKQTAALSLGQLEQPDSIEPLLNLLADPDESVRLHAIAGLKQIESAFDRLQTLAATENLPNQWRDAIATALAEW
ncbi:HEAT repeat domain-containing protein [Microcoleus sp. FACHB-1515]|uniref:HEAT repeat domain-containing protein n=1 Tax=Cyanophyceae TaxID=3028117 RepID=UPI001682C882|nr:HEAT repeat domain-containing protein [Microcoleus sp. FACHB-1515]